MLNLSAILNPSTPTPTTTPTTRTPARTPRETPRGTPRKGRTPTARSPIREQSPATTNAPQQYQHHHHRPAPSSLSFIVNPDQVDPLDQLHHLHQQQQQQQQQQQKHHHDNPQPPQPPQSQHGKQQQDVKMSSDSDSGTESDTSTDSSPMLSSTHHRHPHHHHRPHNHHLSNIHSMPSKGQTSGKTLPALATLSQNVSRSVSRVPSDDSGSDDDETESEDEETRERGRLEVNRRLSVLARNDSSDVESDNDSRRDDTDDDDATEEEIHQTGIGLNDDDETETESDDSEGERRPKPTPWERPSSTGLGVKRTFDEDVEMDDAEDMYTSPPPEEEPEPEPEPPAPVVQTKERGGSKQKLRESYSRSRSRSASRTVSRASSIVANIPIITPPPPVLPTPTTTTTKPKAPPKPKASKAPKPAANSNSSTSMPAAKKKKTPAAPAKKKVHAALANLPPILPPSPTSMPAIPLPKPKPAPRKKGQAKVVPKKKNKPTLPSNLSTPPLVPDTSTPSSPVVPISQTLYCICRLPDTGRWMIACDGCDDWFHGACVNIPETQGDLIDKYFCPRCAAAGRGITTWRRMCRLPGCSAPARTDQKTPSKYCSADHGRQFILSHLSRSSSQRITAPTALAPSQLKALVDTLASTGVGNSAADFKALGERIPTPPLVRRLREGQADPGPYKPELALLGKVKADLTRCTKQKLILTKRKLFLQSCLARRERYKEGLEPGGPGIASEKAKTLCGFDERLLLAEDRFLREVASVNGVMANGVGTTDVMGGDLDDSKPYMCAVKSASCERHKGWGKKFLDEIEGEEGLVEEEMEGLRREEARVGERLKGRVVREGGGGGWVEVEG